MRKAKPQNPYQYSLINSKVPFLAPDVQTKVIPSPVEGWDAISPLAEMDPKRAPILDNWVPRPGYVELRGGYLPFAGAGGVDPVDSLMVYNPADSVNNKMFAAAGGVIYDVSFSQGSTPVLTGQSNDQWQYVNFTPPNGTTVLQAVNGENELIQWNGTVWSNPVITGLPGGSTSSIVNISSQKQRLWFVLNNSTVVAFMGTGDIQGAIAGTQDFGQLWNMGGYCVAIADWTIDGGSGPQDYMAFFSSEGQVSLYAGTDPTNASAWTLVGTFNIPPPIGRRCVLRIGSDVAVITQQGVLPISQALPFDPSADRSVAITTRIQDAMALAVQQYQGNFGWEVSVFSDEQLLILNVPVATNELSYQYVMNTLTGAWCRFTGWNANCFAEYNGNLYWGGNNGVVNQGYIAGGDYTAPIAGDMQCAYNWLDEPGRVKRMTMVQPLLSIGGGITPTIAVDVDFSTSTAVAPITSFGGTVLWDVALWDVAFWPALSSNYINWLSTEAIGHALAIHMRVNLSAVGTGNAYFDFSEFDNATFDGEISPTLPILQVNAFNSIAELGGAI
jgi:hypothetical protein